MGRYDNLVLGGRPYLPVMVLDGDQRVCEFRLPDAASPRGTRPVQPYMCTDCMDLTIDPAEHNVKHDGPVCRVCGCTNDRACDLGIHDVGAWTDLTTCHWVERDLCSNPECVAAATSKPVKEPEVVDLVAALRSSVEAAKQRRAQAQSVLRDTRPPAGANPDGGR